MQPDRLLGAGQDAFSQTAADGTIVLHNLYLVQLSLAYRPHPCKSWVAIISFDPQTDQTYVKVQGLTKKTF